MEKQLSENVFIIQFSHDGIKWYGYGADVVKPATEYDYDSAQVAYGDIFSKWRKPYPATYIRIYGNGKVIQQDELLPHSS